MPWASPGGPRSASEKLGQATSARRVLYLRSGSSARFREATATDLPKGLVATGDRVQRRRTGSVRRLQPRSRDPILASLRLLRLEGGDPSLATPCQGGAPPTELAAHDGVQNTPGRQGTPVRPFTCRESGLPHGCKPHGRRTAYAVKTVKTMQTEPACGHVRDPTWRLSAL